MRRRNGLKLYQAELFAFFHLKSVKKNIYKKIESSLNLNKGEEKERNFESCLYTERYNVFKVFNANTRY